VIRVPHQDADAGPLEPVYHLPIVALRGTEACLDLSSSFLREPSA
jgi:hypothetical protein